jgi:hypothetical protein
MKHEMAHDLPADVAKKVAEKAFDSYREKYAEYRPRLVWVSERHAEASFSVKGVSIKGKVELKARAIVFELDVPFLFRPFKSRAVAVMERELQHWTTKAEQGEI